MRTPSILLRRLFSLLAVVGLLLAVPACDSGSSDDSGDSGNNGTSGGSINGMWKAGGTEELYIYITDDTVTFIDTAGSGGDACYDVVSYDIISNTDGQLNLGDADTPTFTVPFTFTRSGDNLVIGYAGLGLTMSSSSKSVADFTPVCP